MGGVELAKCRLVGGGKALAVQVAFKILVRVDRVGVDGDGGQGDQTGMDIAVAVAHDIPHVVPVGRAAGGVALDFDKYLNLGPLGQVGDEGG